MSVREDDIGQIFCGSRWDWLNVPGLTDRFGKQCLWEWAGLVKFLITSQDWSRVSGRAGGIGQ